ncbi:MAG: ABC transporter substrate-binding protein [Oscillospiraceae bacterium]
MKKITALLLCFTLAFSFAACGAKNTETEGTDLKPITLCLDWTPNTNYTGFYVAQAMGYYKDEGLEVSIVQPPEDGATALCASGKAEFAISAQDSLAAAFAIDDPLEVTAVAALLQHNTSGIISRAGEGLDTPAGLEGKTYSTWNSPIELAMIKYVMEADGADFNKLTLIPNNITDEPGALTAHQTDAIWIFYGWGGITADIRDFDYDFFYFKDIDPVMDYYTPVLIASNQFLESDPDEAKAFLAATAKGFEYAIDHPNEAAQMLIDGDTTGSLKGSEELVQKSQEWMCDQYKAEVGQWGYIDPARWDAFYTWLSDNGLCEKPLEPGTGFSDDYLS